MFMMLSIGFLTLQPSVSAVDVNGDFCTGAAASSTYCNDSKSKKNLIYGQDGMITKIIQVLVLLTAVVSVIIIIIAGFRIALSNGDPNSVKGARDAIVYALVGLVVATFGQIIVSFVLSKLK